MAEQIFTDLESNDKELVENAKRKLLDQLHSVRDSWLVCGLYDYYLNTISARSMEILVNVNEPHYNYLFDKLGESLKNSVPEVRIRALTLLGHIVRSQPTWIYKIAEHHLLRDILRLIKVESDIVALLSALLFLIVLIPMIPSLIGSYLDEIFEIFSYLASKNFNAEKSVEEQVVHLQVALSALFLRLYGMYPCNFLAYLRTNYKEKNRPIFTHTIKPMLETVKMHPSLVTASKDQETTRERWKTMNVHDVIVECERFSLDIIDRCPHESCYLTPNFRSRSGTTNSTTEAPLQLQVLKSISFSNEKEFFTPSMAFQAQTPPITEASAPTNIPHSLVQEIGGSPSFPSQEGTSPPEAAIEATPETTPVRDPHMTPTRSHLNTNVARALTTFGPKHKTTGSSNTTPIHSQPSSPMRKDISSPFNFNPEAAQYGSAFVPRTGMNVRLQKMVLDRSQLVETHSIEGPKPKPAPTSPLKIISFDGSASRHSPPHRPNSPVSQEDEEVLSIVGSQEPAKPIARHCDSVLHESERDEPIDDDHEHGSPCAAGGLHMPNSKSLNDFAKRVQRLRYDSQCNAETEPPETSTGSSPGNCIPFPSTTVRRASSCPEMEKSPTFVKKDVAKPLNETDEESSDLAGGDATKKLVTITAATQTERIFPMPYEHLFLNIFPQAEVAEVKPSPSPSPTPFSLVQERTNPPSVYEILDRYIETSIRPDTPYSKESTILLYQQLLFERNRREMHAYRNRGLFVDNKKTRALDEYNSALRDQVQLQQRDIDNMKHQIDLMRKEKISDEKKSASIIQYWEDRCKILQQDCQKMKERSNSLEKEISELRAKYSLIDDKRQQAEASLSDAITEVNIAREQAWAGERGRAELENVNKQLLLLGELQLKYQEKIDQMSTMKKYEYELDRVKESYLEDVHVKHQQLESKISSLEAARCRVSELEHILLQKEDCISSQKRILIGVNEEYHEKLKAVESKYQTQITINRALEEKMLELRQRLELQSVKGINSPDTSSCHEVNVTTTDRGSIATGLSPHSSPLSASLASSEGSVAFMHPDGRDIKNLQVLVDQRKGRTDESGEGFADNEGGAQPSTSAKHD